MTSPTVVSRLRGRLSSVLGNAQPPELNKENRERRLAYISLYIVWLFIFCHVWKLIPTAYEVVTMSMGRDDKSGTWPQWVGAIEKVSHTLITLNSSLNFLIYIIL